MISVLIVPIWDNSISFHPNVVDLLNPNPENLSTVYNSSCALAEVNRHEYQIGVK